MKVLHTTICLWLLSNKPLTFKCFVWAKKFQLKKIYITLLIALKFLINNGYSLWKVKFWKPTERDIILTSMHVRCAWRDTFARRVIFAKRHFCTRLIFYSLYFLLSVFYYHCYPSPFVSKFVFILLFYLLILFLLFSLLVNFFYYIIVTPNLYPFFCNDT